MPNEAIEGGQAQARTIARRVIVRSLLRDKITFLAMTFSTLIVIVAAGAEFVAPYDPLDSNLRMRNMPPMTPGVADNSFPYVLGTDPLGRDLLSRLIFGARNSLLVGISGALISGTVGSVLGMIAGYYRGRVDDLIMRLVDLMMSMPALLIALFILFVIGPGFLNIILVLSLFAWAGFTRVSRGMTLAYRETAFVDAARVIGCSNARIIFQHLLPNMTSPFVILGTLEVGAIILAEASLSFLGFGIQPPHPSWGLMISEGRQYITSAWWLVTMPGVAIFLTALSLNLLASSIRSLTDPVQRERWLMLEPGPVQEAGR